MAKLKPIKDEEELARIPLDEPVLVELEPAATGAVREAAREDDDRELDNDDGAVSLEKRLEETQAAAKLDRDRADRAEREAARLRTSNADNEKELLTGSLEKAQQDQSVAKEEFKRAYELGDPDAMADAQAKIGRAAADIRSYEGAIASFDETKGAKGQTEQSGDIVAQINNDPKLLPTEREWLLKHPETLTDSALNQELMVAHNRAIKAGHNRGSEAYFKSVDRFMGYEKRQARTEHDDDEPDTRRERPSIVSAPVSRESRSNSGQSSTPTRIVLSPEQRQVAKNMGISEVAYAKGVQRLDAAKRSDPEKYNTRG